MNLSRTELGWLPWFGKTGKIAMGWACFLNKSHYSSVEKTFEAIATTRNRILMHWSSTQWEHLANLADVLSKDMANANASLLLDKKIHMPDVSELFLIDNSGKVMASTCTNRTGKGDLLAAAVSAGLKQPFQHGPYEDAATLAIEPSTSKFHDEVRKLAERTTKAASDIRHMIENVQSEAKSAVSIMASGMQGV